MTTHLPLTPAWRAAALELDEWERAGLCVVLDAPRPEGPPAPRPSEVERAQARYDASKRSFVRHNRLAFFGEQPASGRAFARRRTDIQDARWFWKEVVAARLASIEDLLRRLLEREMT